MVIVSTQCFTPTTGGIEGLMTSLCTMLHESGVTLTVFADGGNNARIRQQDDALGFQVIRLTGFKPWRRRNKVRAINSYLATLQGRAPDLLVDTWKSLELIDPVRFSNIVCLAHGTEFPGDPASRKRARIKRSMEKATYIVANSHFTAERTRQYLQDDARLRIIHPAIPEPTLDPDLDQAVRQEIGSRGPVLITVARLEKRKGQVSVLNTLPAIIQQFPDVLYIIAGEGSERGRLEQTVSRLGLEKHVLFVGKLDDPARNAWLNNSTLFVMPGVAGGDDIEGFGIAYIEAAAFGVPAIASNTGGSPEAVLDGTTGLICRAGDPDQLRDNILTILTEERLHKRLAEHARKRAKTFFWSTRKREYFGLLKDTR